MYTLKQTGYTPAGCCTPNCTPLHSHMYTLKTDWLHTSRVLYTELYPTALSHVHTKTDWLHTSRVLYTELYPTALSHVHTKTDWLHTSRVLYTELYPTALSHVHTKTDWLHIRVLYTELYPITLSHVHTKNRLATHQQGACATEHRLGKGWWQRRGCSGLACSH